MGVYHFLEFASVHRTKFEHVNRKNINELFRLIRKNCDNHWLRKSQHILLLYFGRVEASKLWFPCPSYQVISVLSFPNSILARPRRPNAYLYTKFGHKPAVLGIAKINRGLKRFLTTYSYYYTKINRGTGLVDRIMFKYSATISARFLNNREHHNCVKKLC